MSRIIQVALNVVAHLLMRGEKPCGPRGRDGRDAVTSGRTTRITPEGSHLPTPSLLKLISDYGPPNCKRKVCCFKPPSIEAIGP